MYIQSARESFDSWGSGGLSSGGGVHRDGRPRTERDEENERHAHSDTEDNTQDGRSSVASENMSVCG